MNQLKHLKVRTKVRKLIKKAYNEYVETHKVKPEFLSLSHDDFHRVMIESFNDSEKPFWGMHPLVLSNHTSGFTFHQKMHLDEVLKEFEDSNGRIQDYYAYRVNPIRIMGRDLNSNSELPARNFVTPIEINHKVIKVYQRHLEAIKTE